jgi:hypothetical protein
MAWLIKHRDNFTFIFLPYSLYFVVRPGAFSSKPGLNNDCYENTKRVFYLPSTQQCFGRVDHHQADYMKLQKS